MRSPYVSIEPNVFRINVEKCSGHVRFHPADGRRSIEGLLGNDAPNIAEPHSTDYFVPMQHEDWRSSLRFRLLSLLYLHKEHPAW